VPTTQFAKASQVTTDPAARVKLQEAMGLQNREHFSQTYLASLIKLNDTLAA